MTQRRPKPKPPVARQAMLEIDGCTVDYNPTVPVHALTDEMARAIQDLADAASENAKAIAACAAALKGPSHTFGPGISVGLPREQP